MSDNRRGYEIMRVMKTLKEGIHQAMQEQFKDFQLTGPQLMMIGLIVREGALKISELSETMGLSNSTISGIVDRLEKQACVVRQRDGEDKRVVRVALNPDFQKKASGRFREAEGYWDRITEFANEEELNIIMLGLHTLEAVMKRAANQQEGA